MKDIPHAETHVNLDKGLIHRRTFILFCVCMCVCTHACEALLLSRVQLYVTPWTVACQAPLFMAFPRQEYWNGLPFPSPGDLPDPGMELQSPESPALPGGFFTTEPPGSYICYYVHGRDW